MFAKIQKLRKWLKFIGQQKGLGRKLRWLHYARLANRNGVVNFRIDRIASEYLDDYYADTGVPMEEKEWYYQRGIATYKAKLYGLDKNNYNNYISDFDFYSKYNYQNKLFENWFEHKLNTYYLLYPFYNSLPEHLFFKKGKRLMALDKAAQGKTSPNGVLSFLKRYPLALKACVGGHGKGFFKLELKDGEYLLNGRKTDEESAMALVNSLDNYIITEYCQPHKVFREACGHDSFAVMRAVTVFDHEDGPQITSMIIRLGSKAGDKVVCDYDGTIYCGVDLETGRLFHPFIRSGDKQGVFYGTPLTNHPDTGAVLENVQIPDFQQLKALLKEISSFIPMTPYLVFDIVPVDGGFKILEINSHGQVRNIEPFYPFRTNKYNLKVFTTRDR